MTAQIHDHFHTRFAVRAAPVLAVLLALAALGGILLPSAYSRETATWAAQGIGQDWVNLLVVVPWIALSGAWARREPRLALLLLGGGLVYLVYGFMAYAFAVHFNVLFLIYCAVLGLSFYSLASIGGILHDSAVSSWFVAERIPVRLAGVTQLGSGYRRLSPRCCGALRRRASSKQVYSRTQYTFSTCRCSCQR